MVYNIDPLYRSQMWSDLVRCETAEGGARISSWASGGDSHGALESGDWISIEFIG